MGAGLDDNTQCDCQAGRPVLRMEAVGGGRGEGRAWGLQKPNIKSRPTGKGRHSVRCPFKPKFTDVACGRESCCCLWNHIVFSLLTPRQGHVIQGSSCPTPAGDNAGTKSTGTSGFEGRLCHDANSSSPRSKGVKGEGGRGRRAGTSGQHLDLDLMVRKVKMNSWNRGCR